MKSASQGMRDPAREFPRKFRMAFFKFGAVLLIGGAAAGALVRGIGREIKTLGDLRGERQWISRSFDAIAKISADRAKANQLFPKLASGLPLQVDVPKVLLPAIKKTGEDYGVRASIELQGDRAESGGEPRAVEFLIRADGSPQDLGKFLKGLEAAQFVFHFATLEFARGGGGPGIDQLILSGRVYIR